LRVYITKFTGIDGSCCFLSLFSCQGSGFETRDIVLASLQPVKGFYRQKTDVLGHRRVRLQNQQACVSDGETFSQLSTICLGGRDLIECTGKVQLYRFLGLCQDQSIGCLTIKP